MNNLNEKEREELAKQNEKPTLAPWDVAMAEFVVSPNSPIVGKTLQDSALKEKFGVTIALIERGSKKIIAPVRDTILMSYDLLYLIGNENELIDAKKVIEHKDIHEEPFDFNNYGLDSIILNLNSPYIEKSIRDCGLRENIEGLIVGIERDNMRILNPDSAMILKEGDLLWVVADSRKLQLDVQKSQSPTKDV
jgi:CPA2 family monovalent cation:H+ antiporter-2